MVDYTHDFVYRPINVVVHHDVIEFFPRHLLLPSGDFETGLDVCFVGITTRTQTSFELPAGRWREKHGHRHRVAALDLHGSQILDVEQNMIAARKPGNDGSSRRPVRAT